MATDCLSSPTPFHLALATVVLKNKPNGVTVRDYIASLRANICSTNAASPYQQRAYVDGVGYWKLRCEQLEKEKSELIAEVVDIRARGEELLDEPVGAQRGQRKSARKRKAPSLCDAAERAPKLARGSWLDEAVALCPSSMQGEGRPDDASSHGANVTGEHDLPCPASSAGSTTVLAETRLSCCLFRIRQLLGSSQPPNDTALAVETSGACDALSTIVADACDCVDENLTPGIILSIGRTITGLIYAAGKVKAEGGESGRKAGSAVISAIVSLLGTLLDAVSSGCLQRAGFDKPGPKGREAPIAHRASKAADATKLLTNVLLSISRTELLSPGGAVHRGIFEGLAYMVLRRAGVCLSALTYGRRTDDAGKEVPIIQGATAEVERASFMYEAVHVGQLVERVVGLSPAYLSPPDGPRLARGRSVKPDNRPARGSGGALETSLHPLIRNKLQQTLRECMFPGGGGGGGDAEAQDEFMERLRMPRKVVLKDARRTAGPEKEHMVGDTVGWFTEKMWRAVGWQSLLHEDD